MQSFFFFFEFQLKRRKQSVVLKRQTHGNDWKFHFHQQYLAVFFFLLCCLFNHSFHFDECTNNEYVYMSNELVLSSLFFFFFLGIRRKKERKKQQKAHWRNIDWKSTSLILHTFLFVHSFILYFLSTLYIDNIRMIALLGRYTHNTKPLNHFFLSLHVFEFPFDKTKLHCVIYYTMYYIIVNWTGVSHIFSSCVLNGRRPALY